MKKFLFFATTFAILLSGCTKSNVNDDVLDDGTPVPVRFSAVSMTSSVSTKSTGAVGTIGNNNWNGQDLYIYGYDRAVSDFSTEPFINNVKATAPNGTASGEIDVLNASVNPAEPFYYVAKNRYDFYGYHVDDAATGEPVRETARVYVPFTINGAQDLLIAKADQQADIHKVGASITEENAYSAYAARRDVHPTLKFQHQLARFTFEIVAGSASGSNVNVDHITVDSKSTGNLVVVGDARGIADVTEDVASFKLQEINAEGNAQDLTSVKPEAYSPARDNAKQIGESIMVIPGEAAYTLRIKTSQDGVSTDIPEQEWQIEIGNVVGAPEGAAAFEAGYSYKITIVIYGLEEVKITAELEEWKEGGNATLDEDDIPTE